MALINLRNALMAGKRLPYDAEVEYLESSGTQYIDTGWVLSASDKIVVQAYFKANDSSGGRLLLGVGDPKLWITTGVCRFNGENSASIATLRELEAWNSISIDKDYCTCNGTTVPMSRGTFQNNSLSLWLFGANGSTMTKTNGRIASCKIYHSGVLVRDYIPVRVGTVGYLYDRVSGKLFGNAGTGDFVLGPDVVPVEYIESHGTEYIDTGVVATNSHGFRVDIEAAQKAVDVNTRIFGAHEGNIRCGFALYGKPPNDDYFWGWNEATGFRATIPQRFVVSLNYKNDRAAIFNGTTNLSQLGTLGGMTQSVYLLNANYGNAPFANQFVVGKFYGAEITVGSDVATHYIPVRVGTEGAMMDVLTRRIYRNAGTGAFGYGNDLKYPIPAS